MHNKFLVKFDTSNLTPPPEREKEPSKTEQNTKDFIDSIKSGELAGKSMPKKDFMEKINFDTEIFTKLIQDRLIGDAGVEVFVI